MQNLGEGFMNGFLINKIRFIGYVSEDPFAAYVELLVDYVKNDIGPWGIVNKWNSFQVAFIDVDPETRSENIALALGEQAGETTAVLIAAGIAKGVQKISETVLQTGYHATKPEYAESIKENGFRESTSGRAGGGGVYVNNTKSGAIAEYNYYNPNGPEPTVLKVKYNAGSNVNIYNPGQHINGPLPIYGDTLTFQSTRMPGTYNTIIRNNSYLIK